MARREGGDRIVCSKDMMHHHHLHARKFRVTKIEQTAIFEGICSTSDLIRSKSLIVEKFKKEQTE